MEKQEILKRIITNLLLHASWSYSGVELAANRSNGADHTLLLEVLIAFILAQLNNVVFTLPPTLIQVNACTKLKPAR